MFTAYTWIVENYELVIAVGLLITALSLSGTITQTLRAAKKGFKEAFTPLGFAVLLGIVFVIYLIYQSIMEAV